MSEITDKLQSNLHQQKVMQIENFLLLEKAMSSNDPQTLLRAQEYYQQIAQSQPGPQRSILQDPFDYTNNMGYKSRKTTLSYNTLRAMAKTPIAYSIISTRVDQVASFSQPQINKGDLGFVIRKRAQPGNEEAKVSADEQKIINRLTDFICECGSEQGRWHGDDFNTFLRKFVKDSLELDQATFECIRTRGGSLFEFLATDGATHRHIDMTDHRYGEYPKIKLNNKGVPIGPSHVQVIEDQISAVFYPWELCFGTRNISSDIRLNGYGMSELEVLTNIITWTLYGDQYNGRQFTQGSAPKGFLIAKGFMNDARLNEWRQQWLTQTAGVANSHKLPVMSSNGLDDLQWVNLQQTNKDMEYSLWQEYLLKIHCAIYKISPDEIGFTTKSGAGGSGGSLFESNKESLLKYSQDKGLRPLMKFVEKCLNKFIIRPEYPDFEFAFVGLDAENEKDELALDIQRAGSFMTLKEMRRKHNLPDEIDKDDVILNSMYLQWLGSQQQNQMQQQNPQQFEGEDEDESAQSDFYSQDGEYNPMMKALEDEFKNGYYKNPNRL